MTVLRCASMRPSLSGKKPQAYSQHGDLIVIYHGSRRSYIYIYIHVKQLHTNLRLEMEDQNPAGLSFSRAQSLFLVDLMMNSPNTQILDVFVPSLNLTNRPWKWMVGIRGSFLLGPGLFSGAFAVSFREGKWCSCCTNQNALSPYFLILQKSQTNNHPVDL